MDVLYLGHAGFEVKNEAGRTLLVDPWLSTTGAFLRSWFQFPENHFLAAEIAPVRSDTHAIYLSHSHPDHFDVEFLRGVDKSTPVVTGRYVRRHFARALRGLGFSDVRELNNGEGIELCGFRLSLFVDESYSNEDSGILVEADGTRFLDMNDCRAYDGIDFDAIRPIDLFTIQFSGASWYPVVYDYSQPELDRLAARKSDRKFENVRELIRRVAPRLYVPSAGPACFLDEDLYRFNFGEPTAFPDAEAFLPSVRAAGEEVSHIFPGDRIQLCAGERPRVESGGRFSEAIYDEKTPYLLDYQRRFAAAAALPEAGGDAYGMFRDTVAGKLEALRRPLSTAQRLCLSVVERPDAPDAHLLVDFAKTTLEEVSEPPSCDVYAIRFTNRVLAEFFATGALWDELMLSLRFEARREPDVFDSRISDFMRLEVVDLRAYPRPKREGRICVEWDGIRYEVDRYCPHQGGDLSRGLVADGYLVCPRHGWKFDLRRGGRAVESATTVHAVVLAREDPSGTDDGSSSSEGSSA